MAWLIFSTSKSLFASLLSFTVTHIISWCVYERYMHVNTQKFGHNHGTKVRYFYLIRADFTYSGFSIYIAVQTL